MTALQYAALVAGCLGLTLLAIHIVEAFFDRKGR